MTVYSAFLKTSRFHQSGEGTAFVTVPVENRRRLLDDLFPCLLAFGHEPISFLFVLMRDETVWSHYRLFTQPEKYICDRSVSFSIQAGK
jgi:hypothetical protein